MCLEVYNSLHFEQKFKDTTFQVLKNKNLIKKQTLNWYSSFRTVK